VLGQNPAIYEQILAQIVGTGSIAKFSRSAEREADRLGVTLHGEAGYDPNGMVTMFERLLEQRRQSQPSVGSSRASSSPPTR
jgi:beta-barrel assembly-enhancing protease